MRTWSRRGWLRGAGVWGAAALGPVTGGGLASALGLGTGLLAGCTPADPAAGAAGDPPWQGAWLPTGHEAGHAWRDAPPATDLEAATPDLHCDALVVGAGIAGLAAARSLRQQGVEDLLVLEWQDRAGGNARSHAVDGFACPLGAHYLPVPGEDAAEVRDFLAEAGLMHRHAGRWVADERHRVHAPQERIFRAALPAWQEGLLAADVDDARVKAQLRRFGAEVEAARRGGGFRLPTLRARWHAGLADLDRVSFAAWLDERGLDAPPLRRWLDYACRDDYGAGLRRVSAWAGLHYFASRHGVGEGDGEGAAAEAEDAGVLTWPEGNDHLAQRLAAPLGERLRTGHAVLALQVLSRGTHAVRARVRRAADGAVLTVAARQALLAVPLAFARRLLGGAAPEALRRHAAALPQAAWLVSTLSLDAPPLERVGAGPAWDNVIDPGDAPVVRQAPGAPAQGAAPDAPRLPPALGYVDAHHQRLSPVAPPPLWTHYWALGGEDAAHGVALRRALLAGRWQDWSRAVVDDLSVAHPDLPQRLRRVLMMRWGHAMAIPEPGVRGSADAAVLSAAMLPGASGLAGGRVRLAHADLAGYSVFEEAFTRGHLAGEAMARDLRRPRRD